MRSFRKVRPRAVVAPILARAPGRVNLIGEHTDYNDGLVLPLAIELGTEVGAWPSDDDAVVIESVAMGETARFRVDDTPASVQPSWARYPAGVLARLRANGLPAVGFRAKVESTVPPGGGLSSSAAFTTAFALVAVEVARAQGAAIPPWLTDPRRLAAIGRDAERVATGVRCGIMDPFVALHARAGHALLLDCRDLSHRFVPLDAARVAIVVADSGVRHALDAGAYNERRAECDQAVTRLKGQGLPIASLRDASPVALAMATSLPPVLARRARHVVSEIARTEAAARALEAGDFGEVGRLMNASHESLRDDFAVSCAELDALVEIARACPGVHGSRMTGGGFGGCTVTLADADGVNEVVERITRDYPRRTGKEAIVRVVRPSGAAGTLVAPSP